LGSLYAHRSFNFHSGEGPDSRVEGVTIADGYHSQGAGILVQGASPSIVNCRILRCVAQTDGGAVLCRDDASPVFVGCTFANNKAALYGGGIRLMLRTEADLSACTFRGNTSSRGGGIYSYGGTVALSGSAFLDNRAEEDGGAIYLHGDDGAIRDCLFARNEAETGMGGAACFSNSSPAVTGCTFWGNAAAVAGGIHLRIAAHPSIQNTVIASSKRGCAIYGSDPGYEPVLSCSDLWGNPGGDWISYIAVQNGTSGNFSSDPQFCDAAGGDFTLASTSPCLPGGHPDAFPCGRIGVYEEGCTGPTAVERATWGGIKAMWR
jgi:predicted outer membrane repeat protein